METQAQATNSRQRATSAIVALLRHWTSQPVWSMCLLVLLGTVMLSGPWACLAHCMVLESQAHQHHGHHESLLAAVIQHECPTILHSSEHAAADPPSALAQAIMLPLLVIPILLIGAVRFGFHLQRSHSIAHPPHPRPPRRSISFAFPA